MNVYKILDFIFGRKSDFIDAIQRMMDRSVIVMRAGDGENSYLSFYDRNITDEVSNVTAEELYDYFLSQRKLKLSNTKLVNSNWAIGKDKVCPVKSPSDIDKISTVFLKLWGERVVDYCHLPALKKFFETHRFYHNHNWPLINVVVKSGVPREDDSPLSFSDFLELLFLGECDVGVDKGEVNVIWGLAEGGEYKPNENWVRVNKGLKAFRQQAIPFITKNIISGSVQEETKVVREREVTVPPEVNLNSPQFPIEEVNKLASKLLREWVIYKKVKPGYDVENDPVGWIMVLSARKIIKDKEFTLLKTRQEVVEHLKRFFNLGAYINDGTGAETMNRSGILHNSVEIFFGVSQKPTSLAEFTKKINEGCYSAQSRKTELSVIKPNAMFKLSKREQHLYRKHYQTLLDMFRSWNLHSVGATISVCELEEDAFTLRCGNHFDRPDIELLTGMLLNFDCLGVNRQDGWMVRVIPSLMDSENGNAIRTLRFAVTSRGSIGKQEMFIQDGVPFHVEYQYKNMVKMIEALQEGGELYSYLFGKPLYYF